MLFTKMQGLGNDYVHVNCFSEQLGAADLPELARQVSDRHRGIGSDGLILMLPSERGDLRMEMYNGDGGRAEMCGNGIRCVALYALEHGLTRSNPMIIETDAGPRVAKVGPGAGGIRAVTVVMGEARFDAASLPARFEGERIRRAEFQINGRSLLVSCVSVGNPHAVVFVSDLGEIDLERDGRALETDAAFPERINVHFARMDGPGEVTIKSWERGSGATQACGTGACAVAVLADTEWPVRVHVPGGELVIDRTGTVGERDRGHADLIELAGSVGMSGDGLLLMTGPAEEVFRGEWPSRQGSTPVQ